MKHRIHWILAAVAVLVLCSALFTCASAESRGTWGNLSWTLDDEGLLTISGNGSMDDFTGDLYGAWLADRDTIKSAVISEGVTGIGNYAFYNCSGLTSVAIPAGVTGIGISAFYNCSGLTSVAIPAGVTGIGGNAFRRCSGLTSVAIPAGVTSIGGNAFRNCESLTSVVIPAGVTSISDSVFRNCKILRSVVIPDSVTSIGGNAFRDCESLTSVVIPDSVTSIGGNAFRDCSRLTSVVIPDSVTSIGGNAFNGCSRLTSVVIPTGVTSIDVEAFMGCSDLTSVFIPAGVTSIGMGAFYGCSSLTGIWYEGTAEDWEQVTKGDGWNSGVSAAVHFGPLIDIPFTFSGSGSGTVTVTDVRNRPFTLHSAQGSKTLALWEGTVRIEAVPDAFNRLSNMTLATNNHGLEMNTELTDGTFAVGGSSTYSVEVGFTAVLSGRGTEDDPWLIGQDCGALAMISGCYEVTADAGIAERVTVGGEVCLALDGGKTLTVPKGINVPAGSSLTISGTGALTAGAEQNNAGIGGDNGQDAGSITIDGGTVTVSAATFASGIGGGYMGGAGEITINGGTVDIQHADNSSGIGTGREGSGGSVTINGGTVYARGRFAAGIGGGDLAPGIDVTITGGTVYAQSWSGGAGIGGGPYNDGGDVIITGGHVTAIGGEYGSQGAPGIGSGRPRTNGLSPLNAGTCEISGGTVIAVAGNTNAGTGAQAIGANYQDIAADPAHAGTLILGETAVWTAETAASPVAYAAREEACRGGWVKAEACGHSFGWDAGAEAILCAWCGKAAGTPPFGSADFALPAGVTAIAEEAFEGDTSITAVDAHNCETIGAGAFSGCTGLRQIRLPKDCGIDETAFDGCGTVYVFAPAGGTAQAFCAAAGNCVFVAE